MCALVINDIYVLPHTVYFVCFIVVLRRLLNIITVILRMPTQLYAIKKRGFRFDQPLSVVGRVCKTNIYILLTYLFKVEHNGRWSIAIAVDGTVNRTN